MVDGVHIKDEDREMLFISAFICDLTFHIGNGVN
jgi:hypothetical protein